MAVPWAVQVCIHTDLHVHMLPHVPCAKHPVRLVSLAPTWGDGGYWAAVTAAMGEGCGEDGDGGGNGGVGEGGGGGGRGDTCSDGCEGDE